MAKETIQVRSLKRTKKTEGLPRCPVCGNLECMCRPRFFAGQLLTDEDLNLLDRYIRQKNRLHNRHLHGWGVVCGLEVTCHDCDDKLKVSSGYALSPCGDDIVVCEDALADICTIIRKCKQEDRRCDPPRSSRDEDCDDGIEKWILTICYDETPSRHLSALKATSACCTSCGKTSCDCGGGCGCNGKHNGHKNGHTTVKPKPIPCEATVICEGYYFDAYKAPVRRLGEKDMGALIERFKCCVQPYIDFAKDAKTSYPHLHGSANANSYDLWNAMRERLRAILLERPVYNCELLRRLDCVRFSGQTGFRVTHTIQEIDDDVAWVDSAEGFQEGQAVMIGEGPLVEEAVIQSIDGNRVQFTDNLGTQQVPVSISAVVGGSTAKAYEDLLLIWLEGLLACFCSVLLPPCPEPATSNCVPLASVTVRKRDCRVLSVCNWTTHRKLVTSFPNLQYWLSPLPFGRQLRAMLDKVCCEGFSKRKHSPKQQEFDTIHLELPMEEAAAPRMMADTPGTGHSGVYVEGSSEARAFSRNILESALRGVTRLEPSTLFWSLMDIDREDMQSLRSGERENLLQYLVTSELAAPMLRGMMPSVMPEIVKQFGAGSRKRKTMEETMEVEDLKSRVEDLSRSVAEQQALIMELTRKMG